MQMLITALKISCVFWIMLAIIIWYIRHSPAAKIHEKMEQMIQQAQEKRNKLNQKNISDSQQKPDEPTDTSTFFYRVILPIIENLEKKLHQLTPSVIAATLENYIFQAGKQGVWSLQKVASIWVLSIILGFILALLVVQQTNLLLPQQIIVLLFGIFFGAVMPFAFLNSKIRERKRELKRQLPEFLDLLCVSVQAGLSFDGAVAKILTRMDGTLTDEFRHMQDDIRFGMTKQYALTQVGKRCDIEEMYLFTTSIIQAEKLGSNMSQTLRVQADNMRERHRQYIKAEAMKAPVKMIFPMVLFIFPAVFVVLLFPSIISLVKNLGS